MRWRTFLVWNALGGVAWAVSIGLAAYLLGHVAATIFRAFGLVGIAVAVLGACVLLLWQRLKRRQGGAATEAEQGNQAP